MTVLVFLMLVLTGITNSAGRAWRDGQGRTDAFQSARSALELMSRELAPAIVDTRMQFAVGPGTILTDKGAPDVAPESPVILWMAPLGEEGTLRCVGYYLSRDVERRFYRLKRLYIAPADSRQKPVPFFPLTNTPSGLDIRTSPVDASWFTHAWTEKAFDEEDPENTSAIVSSASDGVIALWIQCLDALGNPVPLLHNAANHPKSDLFYNSAAYFQMATTSPFEEERSVVYLAETLHSMKANRVPAAVELTIVTLDTATLAKGTTIPEQANLTNDKGSLDVEASLQKFQADLQEHHIYHARTFSTRTKLANGS